MRGEGPVRRKEAHLCLLHAAPPFGSEVLHQLENVIGLKPKVASY
jgi:hypothetical protein